MPHATLLREAGGEAALIFQVWNPAGKQITRGAPQSSWTHGVSGTTATARLGCSDEWGKGSPRKQPSPPPTHTSQPGHEDKHL